MCFFFFFFFSARTITSTHQHGPVLFFFPRGPLTRVGPKRRKCPPPSLYITLFLLLLNHDTLHPREEVRIHFSLQLRLVLSNALLSLPRYRHRHRDHVHGIIAGKWKRAKPNTERLWGGQQGDIRDCFSRSGSVGRGATLATLAGSHPTPQTDHPQPVGGGTGGAETRFGG